MSASPAHSIDQTLSGLQSEIAWLHKAGMRQALRWYDEFLHFPLETETMRACVAELGRYDRFFLLTHLMHRTDAVHPWLYERCREVEADPDGFIDLWARDHYKSTFITFAGSIQEVLTNPEMTIGIFSHTRPIAKGFLTQIKMELENNEDLKRVYPEVLWQTPKRDAPSWSLDGGLTVRRRSNPKEQTFEAWGLVDGQPTGKHFRLGVFDDVVTLQTVHTPDQIVKTITAWEHAQNLLTSAAPRRWMIGTMYKYGDPYHQIKERGAAKPRVYPATDDGTVDGKPVFLSQDVWNTKVKESSIETIAAQMLQNPAAGTTQEFKPDWVRRYELRPETLNVYITCDYAGSRASTGSSRTAIAVQGFDSAQNVYLLDGVCHRMDLHERWERIRDLRRKWLKGKGIQIVAVGYERFGAQSDIQYFERMMQIEGEAFDIEELSWPREGDVSKDNRIRRLIPIHKNWKYFYPYEGDPTRAQITARQERKDYLISEPVKAINEEGKLYNVVDWMLRNEYLFFPHTTAKDFLDAMSRIFDMEPTPPLLYMDRDLVPEVPEE